MIQRTIVFACLAVASCKSAPNNVDAAPPSEPASAPAAPPTAAPSGTAAAGADCDPTCSYSAKCNRIQMSGSDHACCEPITKPDAKEAERCRKIEQEAGGRIGGGPTLCDKTCEYSVQCKRVQTSGSTLPCCEPILRPDPPAAERCRKIESQSGQN